VRVKKVRVMVGKSEGENKFSLPSLDGTIFFHFSPLDGGRQRGGCKSLSIYEKIKV